MRGRKTFVTGIVAVMCWAAGAALGLAQDAEPQNARTWLGRAAQIEEFIRTAEVTNVEDIGVGVTNPKSADIVGDGPIDRIVFKPLRPGIYRGYWESYRSEIAAYQLDKLLELGMTPPTVEKRVNGDLGAASMYVAPTQSFKDLDGPPTAPSTQIGRLNYQLIRAKMFHNLIYNKDQNLGNWLVDPAWNLILIDNSRALTTDDEMVHKLIRIDRDLWDRFVALDEPSLSGAVGDWLSDDEVRAILTRRDSMAEDIEEMVEERGESTVFVRFMRPPSTPASTASETTTAGDLLALGGRLVNAINETPVVLPGSELTWIGQVVRLVDYQGPDHDIAGNGVAASHVYGIVTKVDGLLCLTADETNPEHYDTVIAIVGKEAEVFGLVTDAGGLPVVQVTLSREVQ